MPSRRPFVLVTLISSFAIGYAIGPASPVKRCALPPPPPSITVDGARIAYNVEGNGPIMFLIHGFPLSGELFSKVKPLLKKNYQVVTPDLRGFGHSTTPTTDGSVQVYAKDMFALMDKIGVKKAIIGGMSMGGPVVLEMYREQPDRFKGMILIDSTTSPASVVETKEWPGFGKQAEEKGVASMAPLLMPNMLTASTRAHDPGLVKEITGIVKEGSVNGAKFGGATLANRPDSRTTKIEVPVLILTGHDDPIYPLEMQMKMHQDIPGSHLAVIPGAAHAAIIEKPEESAKAILNWAKEIK